MSAPFRSVTPAQAGDLVRAGAVRVLDVRTPDEFRELGHIPGAVLLPVGLVMAAPATLSREGPPWLVCCEHGIRSAHAAGVLVRAGFEGVLNLAGGLAAWNGARDFGPGDPWLVGPSAWLVTNADLIPRRGEALDIACGSGRNALLLAAAGLEVLALDADPGQVEALADAARRLGLPLRAERADLEAAGVDLGSATADLIVVFHYLHRPLFPALIRALRPGGVLLYETFTIEQASRDRPRNPDFLLQAGELSALVEPLEVLRQREGDFEGRMVSAVAARKTA